MSLLLGVLKAVAGLAVVGVVELVAGDVAHERPSDITTIRSLAASSSGSSEEMMMTALPDLARSRISAMISDFEPMSMPAVGSSRISRGSAASHLAMTTFCALPPESVRTRCARRS